MLSLPTLPGPPSLDVTVDVVFTLRPALVPVTAMMNEHDPDGPRLAPVRLIDSPPAGALTAAPPQVAAAPAATCSPSGSVSVKPTPVSVLLFGLLIVNCRV